jgi:hypothetical protein
MPNTYPALPQFVGTKYSPRFNMQERISRNGSVRLRKLASPKYDIVVVHDLLTQANRNTLVTFYNANSTLPILFTAVEDGVQRTMLFAGQGYDIEPRDSGLYKATVYLREV